MFQEWHWKVRQLAAIVSRTLWDPRTWNTREPFSIYGIQDMRSEMEVLEHMPSFNWSQRSNIAMVLWSWVELSSNDSCKKKHSLWKAKYKHRKFHSEYQHKMSGRAIIVLARANTSSIVYACEAIDSATGQLLTVPLVEWICVSPEVREQAIRNSKRKCHRC